MPTIPALSTLTAEDSAVKLPRYAQIIQADECAFFGVFRDDAEHPDCRDIWTKAQRDDIARYLAEAQEEIENEVGYFLSPRYVVGQLSEEPNGNDRLTDNRRYGLPLSARWMKVIAGGVRAATDVALASVVNHAADPAVVGPIATALTDTAEIHVYHPGTDVEIWPSVITITGGNLTITIPRCRMVKSALADNPKAGLDYNDTTNFESTVDVKRIYTDSSTNAVLVWPHQCNSVCASCGCSEYTQTACIYIRDERLGTLDVLPATYSDGSWRGSGASCLPGRPERVRLNYLAGMKDLTRQAEDVIVRLAHAKQPAEMCGCQVAHRMWERDRNVPTVLTRERLNAPWGFSDGAYTTWRWAQTMKVSRGSVL